MDTPVPARLLVVEDDPALNEVLCEQLRTLGHTAVSASTAIAPAWASASCIATVFV